MPSGGNLQGKAQIHIALHHVTSKPRLDTWGHEKVCFLAFCGHHFPSE
jgi:hypothetical protein